MGRCGAKTGIEPFDRLVVQAMPREPCHSAPHGLWVGAGAARSRRVLRWSVGGIKAGEVGRPLTFER
jgi:hypothetical protein